MNSSLSRVPRALLVAAVLGATGVIADEPGDDDFDRTPQDCVSLNRIDRTEIIDEQTILFFMNGRQVYRNQLPQACRGLRPHDPIMYEPRSVTRRLCSTDYIDLLTGFGSNLTRGRSCRLGSFYPMTQAELEDFKRSGPSPVEVESATVPEPQESESAASETPSPPEESVPPVDE